MYHGPRDQNITDLPNRRCIVTHYYITPLPTPYVPLSLWGCSDMKGNCVRSTSESSVVEEDTNCLLLLVLSRGMGGGGYIVTDEEYPHCMYKNYTSYCSISPLTNGIVHDKQRVLKVQVMWNRYFSEENRSFMNIVSGRTDKEN